MIGIRMYWVFLSNYMYCCVLLCIDMYWSQWRVTDDGSCLELASGLIIDNFLPIPDAECLPLYPLVLVVCDPSGLYFMEVCIKTPLSDDQKARPSLMCWCRNMHFRSWLHVFQFVADAQRKASLLARIRARNPVSPKGTRGRQQNMLEITHTSGSGLGKYSISVLMWAVLLHQGLLLCSSVKNVRIK